MGAERENKIENININIENINYSNFPRDIQVD